MPPIVRPFLNSKHTLHDIPDMADRLERVLIELTYIADNG